MNMRQMQGIPVKASLFGMGCMRFITRNGVSSDIVEDDAIRIIHSAIDGGCNYFDTAYVYHGGESETVLGKALANGKRKDVHVATKLACWMANTYDDMERMLDESLKKLQTDYVDFFLLHSLTKERFEQMQKLDFQRFLDEMVKKGKVRYPSFSFHDDADTFKAVIDSYPFAMAQIQMNLLDVYNQATLDGMRYAAEKGVNIVVMEPLRGGLLASNVPESVQALYDAFPVKRSHVEWAFRFLYQFPEVKVILSGINTMEQLNDNLRIFENAAPFTPDAQERKLYEDVRLAYESRTKVNCTGCRYCVPCPMEVSIPDIFQSYNTAAMFEAPQRFTGQYKDLIAKGNDASKCVECGNCEGQCPQHIQIIQKLKEAHAYAEKHA